MEKKRFIFDLDHTLLFADYQVEKDYFRDIFRSDADSFVSDVVGLLYEYEKIYPKYDLDILSNFMTEKTRLDFNKDVINGWIEIFGNCDNRIDDGVLETLEFLKSRDISIAVLTNWFKKSQEMRLKNSGLLEFIDDIYAGDFNLKPRREAYISARDRFNNSECVFIGDNLEKDYIGPRIYNMASILYDKDDVHNDNLIKIKRIDEIKKALGG